MTIQSEGSGEIAETSADLSSWNAGEDEAWAELEGCDHDDADIDLIEGQLTCRCGHRRHLSDSELSREATLQAELMDAYYSEAEQSPNSDVSSG